MATQTRKLGSVSGDLVEHLHALELELLSESTRKDTKRLSELLDDAFQEFGISGRVYRKQDIIAALQPNRLASLSLTSFHVQLISTTVALVTYRSHKPDRIRSRTPHSAAPFVENMEGTGS